MRSNSLKPVDVNLFKVFAAIYGQRNLTRAGDTLAMTQPAVSRALDRLRAVFNDRLFHRMEGEMRPTRTAELLAPMILEGLARLEASLDMKAHDTPALQAVNLRLGINDYLSMVVLPQVLARLDVHWPRAFLSTVATTYESAPEQVLREEIDCAIVSSVANHERVATQPLFEEDYVAVTARNHPLAGRPLDLEAYLSFRHLLVSYTGVRSGWVDRRLERLGRTRCIGAAVHLYAGTPELLLGHPYICTMPRKLGVRLAAVHPLSVHELPFESECHVFHLMWARHLTLNPLSMAMRAQIAAACAALASEPVRRAAAPLLSSARSPAAPARSHKR
jgi:DNA-binding transcriptional LysR family regulator